LVFVTRFLNYDEAALADRLAGIEPWQKAAFATACAQRMLPVYLKYCAVTGEGDAAFAPRAIDKLWRALEDAVLPADELQGLLDGAEELIPPGEAAGMVVWYYYAADALAALIYAIKCQQGDLVQEAVWAARQPFDVVTNYVEYRDDLNYNSEADRLQLDRDPEVQTELRRQDADLRVLEGRDSRAAMVKRLREVAERSPVFDLEGLE
jgi:uncharacterized protein YjaG (DUF416 family)